MRNTMRKTLIAATAAITLAVTTIAVPTVADARWGGGWLLRVFILNLWLYQTRTGARFSVLVAGCFLVLVTKKSRLA